VVPCAHREKGSALRSRERPSRLSRRRNNEPAGRRPRPSIALDRLHEVHRGYRWRSARCCFAAISSTMVDRAGVGGRCSPPICSASSAGMRFIFRISLPLSSGLSQSVCCWAGDPWIASGRVRLPNNKPSQSRSEQRDHRPRQSFEPFWDFGIGALRARTLLSGRIFPRRSRPSPMSPEKRTRPRTTGLFKLRGTYHTARSSHPGGAVALRLDSAGRRRSSFWGRGRVVLWIIPGLHVSANPSEHRQFHPDRISRNIHDRSARTRSRRCHGPTCLKYRQTWAFS